MIYTEYLKRNCMENISILRKEDYEFFDKKVFNGDKGKTFKSLIENPRNNVLIFNRGIVIFDIYDTDDTNGFNFDRVCYLSLLYKAKDSKIDWKVAYKEFLRFLKLNKCTKMLMNTKLKPEFWQKKYNFKLKTYELELDL